jgi:hypothetical protein
MALLSICFYVCWKIINHSGPNGPKDTDLVWERLQVDAYEATVVGEETTFRGEIAQLFYKTQITLPCLRYILRS